MSINNTEVTVIELKKVSGFPANYWINRYTVLDISYATVSQYDGPTYTCCGTNDGIASWRTMQSRLESLSALGIPTEFHSYSGLPHGFGLGTSTVAEGWLTDALCQTRFHY